MYNGLIISSDVENKKCIQDFIEEACCAFSTSQTKITGRHDIKMDLVERATWMYSGLKCLRSVPIGGV
jgi:hypothetical protein